MENIILINILKGVYALAQIYLLFMFVMAIISILAVFRVVDIFSDGFASKVYFTLRRIIDPAVNVIARFVPRFGQFDLPFLVLLILLWIVTDLCQLYIGKLQSAGFGF